MSIKYLDIELMEKMCHKLALNVFDTTEDPIACFNDHDEKKLDSALKQPMQSLSGEKNCTQP